ncbi:hypothetical protein PVK06_043334 [Gossypium arboreum]|uniref:Uncharacterized protein n=1 Tax=Gossypium arboreum TaxID=29729 RepID=A0ABR0MNL4_GOSAR|nr:hypothetical protein PVK06_043334 [Gossypium arboreum]
MATETLDDKKPEEEEVIDKENKEGSKEVLEKQIEVEEKENEEEEEEEEEGEEEEKESEDEGTKKFKCSSRNRSSRKSGRDSTEKKEPVMPSSDRPTMERKVAERYSAPYVARSSTFKTLSIEKGRGTQLKDIPNGMRMFSCLFVFPPKVLLYVFFKSHRIGLIVIIFVFNSGSFEVM